MFSTYEKLIIYSFSLLYLCLQHPYRIVQGQTKLALRTHGKKWMWTPVGVRSGVPERVSISCPTCGTRHNSISNQDQILLSNKPCSICETEMLSPVWWGLHGTLIPLDSTYGSPGPPPPQIKKKLITIFHQITSIFYMLLEDSFGVTSISKFSWGLDAYIKNVYAFCWPMYTDLEWPGYTFAVAGDRAI